MSRLILLTTLFFSFIGKSSFAQCPEEIYSEDFNTPGYPGLIPDFLYTSAAGGTWDNPTYMLDGTSFGWWNIVNGVGDVDVYSIDVIACPTSEIEISIFLRESFGGTNIDLFAYDGTGALMDSENINLTSTYTEYTLNFVLGTDPNINFVIHCNTVGGGGIDICAENLSITSNDITPPVVADPMPDLFGECLGDFPPDITAVTGITDNCSPTTTVTHVGDVEAGTCPVIVTRTYEVTDECSNATLVDQIITLEDLTPPTASNPAPLNVECIGDIPLPDVSVVTDALDNCSVPTISHVSDVSDGGACPEIITRTYRVEDDCSNFIEVNQIITVQDITAPTASTPPMINVPCTEDVPVPDITVITDATDNCGTVTIVHLSDVSDGEVCNFETITRTYELTDDCGNSSTITQDIMIMATYPNISAGPDINGCEDEIIILTADNPDGATITWSAPVLDGVGFTSPIGSSTYTLTGSVCATACVITDDVIVTIDENPSPNFSADTLIGCPDHTVLFESIAPSGSVDCFWDFGDGATSSICSPVSHTYTSTGLFDVTLTVTTSNGCTTTLIYPDYIEVVESPVASFYSSSITGADNEIVFYNESSGADTYEWFFGDGGSSNAIDPSHTYTEGLAGTYTVSLTATNSIGCSDTYESAVSIEAPVIYYVPNVFTPDGDEFNETFQPVFTTGYEPYDFHLTIFNRWGELIFESYNSIAGWNGTYGNQGLVADGVYVWQIDFGLSSSDERIVDRGTVTVLK